MLLQAAGGFTGVFDMLEIDGRREGRSAEQRGAKVLDHVSHSFTLGYLAGEGWTGGHPSKLAQGRAAFTLLDSPYRSHRNRPARLGNADRPLATFRVKFPTLRRTNKIQSIQRHCALVESRSAASARGRPLTGN